jgi:hypothetical protein
MSEFEPSDLIPKSMVGYAERHPKVLLVAAIALVGLATYNLIEAVGIYQKAKRFIGELDRAASEALGG